MYTKKLATRKAEMVDGHCLEVRILPGPMLIYKRGRRWPPHSKGLEKVISFYYKLLVCENIQPL